MVHSFSFAFLHAFNVKIKASVALTTHKNSNKGKLTAKKLSNIVKGNEAESCRADKQHLQIFTKYGSRLNWDQIGLGLLTTGNH